MGEEDAFLELDLISSEQHVVPSHAVAIAMVCALHGLLAGLLAGRRNSVWPSATSHAPAETSACAHEEHSAAPAAEPTVACSLKPVVESRAPFEFVSSDAVDEATGQRLSDDLITRGVTRLETILFRVGRPLVGLQRRCVNYKHFPVVGFRNVGVDLVEMGNYEPLDQLQAFAMPGAKIPNLMVCKGRYRIEVTYSARNVAAPLFFKEHEFTVL